MARSSDVRLTGAKIEYGGITLEGVSADVVDAPSSSVTWSAVIPDLDIGLQPALKPERFVFGSIPTKKAKITLYTESGTREWSDLVLINRNPTINADYSGEVVLSGKDLSHMLSLDNKTKVTYENQTAFYIITDFLEDAGITSYSFSSELQNYLQNYFPVMQMDVQRDRYINRIQTLLNECGAVWRMDGATFRAWIPNNTAAPAKTFNISELYNSFSFQESSTELFDKVKVTRMNKNANVALQTSGYTSGRPNSGLSGTFYQVHFSVIDNKGCNVTDVEWFYQGASQGGGFNLLGPVDQVYFTVNALSSPLYYEVKITGIPEAMMGTGIDLNAQYEATLPGTSGDNPAPDIQSNFTPNNTLAELKAKAFLREQGSLRTNMTLPVKVQPILTLEDRLRLNIERFNLTWDCNIETIRTYIRPISAWQEFDVKVFES